LLIWGRGGRILIKGNNEEMHPGQISFTVSSHLLVTTATF